MDTNVIFYDLWSLQSKYQAKIIKSEKITRIVNNFN